MGNTLLRISLSPLSSIKPYLSGHTNLPTVTSTFFKFRIYTICWHLSALWHLLWYCLTWTFTSWFSHLSRANGLFTQLNCQVPQGWYFISLYPSQRLSENSLHAEEFSQPNSYLLHNKCLVRNWKFPMRDLYNNLLLLVQEIYILEFILKWYTFEYRAFNIWILNI